METGTVNQTVEFKSSPHDVYHLLMDSEKHSGFTGEECEISQEVEGKFSCYGGYIEGKNLELEHGKKIVQEWRGKDFPEGHYSTVTFELDDNGSGGTKLKLTHEDVPEDKVEHIGKGWQTHYWDKMQKFLGE